MNEVAKTILAQMGGMKLCIMTGAKDFIGTPNSLSFKIPTTKNGINRIKITLDPSDTYTMVFSSERKRDGFPYVTEKASFEDVYCDMLQTIFKDTTGLNTHL